MCLDFRNIKLWFSILYLPFVFLRQKVNFVPPCSNGEFVSFIGYILLTKSLPCKCAAIIGMP
jgi:hypothetical protein